MKNEKHMTKLCITISLMLKLRLKPDLRIERQIIQEST
jgi:hypothetical protein